MTKIVDVALAIQIQIEQGTYPVGHCLPPGRVLEKVYHCSRETLGKALRILTEKNIITTTVNIQGRPVVTKNNIVFTQEEFASLKEAYLHLYTIIDDNPPGLSNYCDTDKEKENIRTWRDRFQGKVEREG